MRRRPPPRRGQRRDAPHRTLQIPNGASGVIHHGKRGGVSMAAAIELRDDLSGEDLRRLARASRDAKQARRLLALAVIRDGGSRTEAARIGGVGCRSCGTGCCASTPRGSRACRPQRAGRADADGGAGRRWRRGGGRPRAVARRGGALAADRPRAVAVGGVPGGDARATVGGSCGRSAFAGSRRGRGTKARTRRRRRLSKKSPGGVAEVRAAHPGKR